jgi:hypothetical protein
VGYPLFLDRKTQEEPMPNQLRAIPDWLTAELKGIDPALAVRWNERRQRWQIMRKRSKTIPPSALTKRDISEREWWQYVTCFTWENDDGTYRDLDMRIIHALRLSDLHVRDFRDVIREMEDAERKLQEEKSGKIREIEEEMYGALHDAVVGKAFSGAHADSKRQA